MAQYGHFDDANREFVITRPDTPLPWLNMLGQDEFYGLCTQTAGGYSFWKDARLRRLTRYRYNNNPMDNDGRFLYVKHGKSVWNPGWKPVRAELDGYECRHGLGYTQITGQKDGIAVQQLMFIPPNENLEVWKITVSNNTKKAQKFSIFPFVEFCSFEALNDMTNYQRTYSIGEVEIEGNGIYHKTEYRERRNHYTLFASTKDIAGYDTSRDAFVGVHNGLHDPKVPFAGKCTNSRAYGWSPVGAFQLDFNLKPGATETFALILAYVDQGDLPKFDAPFVMNKTKGKEIIAKYSDIAAVDAAFNAVKERWESLLSVYQAPKVPNEHLRRMVNTWNQAQCMATFNLSRSASGYETGIGRGMGYRDSNQDILGFVHLLPERARQRILDIASTQLSDGTCFHQYQPLTKKGNADIGGGFNDDPLWLILSTAAYIRETKDLTILDEPCGYADKKGSKDTLLHHLETSIAYTLNNRGPHALPLIGHADWNDCLNLNCFSKEPNESFQVTGDIAGSKAESVMIAGLFVYYGEEYAEICDEIGLSDEAKLVRGEVAIMYDAVLDAGWDGEWFRRAYDAYGNPVGSSVCEEGQIYIEPQGMCVMAGIGVKEGQAARALESVKQRLDTKYGIVLHQPAYTRYHLELGEISSYPPGYKENASIFCHNNPWVSCAETVLGHGDRAFEVYQRTCPAYVEEISEIRHTEPYVYCQTVAGIDAPSFGEGKNSWLTGTAAWTFMNVSQYILGIRPTMDGLAIDPCLPSSLDGFSCERLYRGVRYHIQVKKPAGVSKGVKHITVDGKQIDGNVIPFVQGAVECRVEVVMG